MTTVAILAGGAGTRIGGDKASRLLAGRSLLQWVIDAIEPIATHIIVSAPAVGPLPAFSARIGVTVVRDRGVGLGPLSGIRAALDAAAEPLIVVPCDAPLVRPELLAGLLAGLGDADVVVPEVRGRLQSAFGAWSARAVPVIERALAGDDRSVHGVVGRLDARIMSEGEVRAFDPDLRSFRSANTPGDLASLEALLATNASPANTERRG